MSSNSRRKSVLGVEQLDRRDMLTGGLGPDFGERPYEPLITGGPVHAVPFTPFLPPPVVNPQLLPNPSLLPVFQPSDPFVAIEYQPLRLGPLTPQVGKWLPR